MAEKKTPKEDSLNFGLKDETTPPQTFSQNSHQEKVDNKNNPNFKTMATKSDRYRYTLTNEMVGVFIFGIIMLIAGIVTFFVGDIDFATSITLVVSAVVMFLLGGMIKLILSKTDFNIVMFDTENKEFIFIRKKKDIRYIKPNEITSIVGTKYSVMRGGMFNEDGKIDVVTTSGNFTLKNVASAVKAAESIKLLVDDLK